MEILIPVNAAIVGIDASAGTKYSLVIYPDGRAFSGDLSLIRTVMIATVIWAYATPQISGGGPKRVE
jgi:hypothetical protein